MKYNFLFFLVLFIINNLLHLISEKVIIIIFIIFLYFLLSFIGNLIKTDFSKKLEFILSDINMYMNAIFNFLYINKLIYLNFKQLNVAFIKITSYLVKKIRNKNLLVVLTAKN